jgi:lipoprotein NlpI
VSSIETIRLDPNDFRPGHSRSSDPAKSDLERVIAHYSDTIMLDANDDDAYFRRGVANLYAGSPSKALADISRASELDPAYPYYELWLHMIEKRSNRPSRLAQALAHIDMKKWPAPIIQLFLGQATPQAVLAAAAASDAQTQRGQVCEANFYIGQVALQQGAIQEATRRFRLAAADCPRDFVERPAASAELAALDMAR